MEENELRKKQEQAMREKLLAEEAKQQDPKVPFTHSCWIKEACSKDCTKPHLHVCRSKPRRRGTSSRN